MNLPIKLHFYTGKEPLKEYIKELITGNMAKQTRGEDLEYNESTTWGIYSKM